MTRGTRPSLRSDVQVNLGVYGSASEADSSASLSFWLASSILAGTVKAASLKQTAV